MYPPIIETGIGKIRNPKRIRNPGPYPFLSFKEMSKWFQSGFSETSTFLLPSQFGISTS
jgi:hypothetical protein